MKFMCSSIGDKIFYDLLTESNIKSQIKSHIMSSFGAW
jgi:hypothetical protein